MKKVYYNKLVRDRIPEKIRAKGSECEVRELSDEELEKELLKKVGEEASALPVTNTREELIAELADVADVIDEIRRFKDISEQEIHTAQAKNAEKKGGFLKKLFLVWSSDDGYTTNEKGNSGTSLVPSP